MQFAGQFNRSFQQIHQHAPSAQRPSPNQPPKSQLPFWNTYVHRLKTGDTLSIPSTNLIKNVKIPIKKYNESSDSEDSISDESDEISNVRRSSRRVVSTAIPPPTNSATTPASTTTVPLANKNSNTLHVPPFKKIMRKSRHRYLSKKDTKSLSEMTEVLIPIRLELDLDGFKLRDTFTWNINEAILTPEHFADLMCDDLDLQSQTFSKVISGSIKQQISEAAGYYEIPAPYIEDARIPIQLDILVGRTHFRDQFEWDVTSTTPPEVFAKSLVSDLGLGGEFVSVIAHSIHEQIHQTRVSLFDQSFSASPGLASVIREEKDTEDWSPYLEILSDDELEKIMIASERNSRRLRRSTIGGMNTRSSRSTRYRG